MLEEHQVHALRTNLEAVRLRSIERLARSEGPLTADVLRELAMIQAALTAVREEIDELVTPPSSAA
jgi:hypothetical protein